MSACSQLNVVDAPKGSAENPFLLTQGITFRLTNKVKKSAEKGGGPFDLTGFTGRSQMREDPESVGSPVADLTVTILSPETSGCAEVSLDPSISVNILPGTYVFDIEYIDGLDPENIISGTGGTFRYIQVIPGVTKP
jgi:hypothetical protein